MEARPPNIPHASAESATDSTLKERVPPETGLRDGGAAMASKTPFRAWVGTLWALVTHCILSVGVIILIIVYVEDRHFNVTERTPPVHVFEASQATPFLPMQSDIVTVLSSIIAVSKYALAAWVAALCWYAALFLMERRGLARRDLKTLFDYELLAPGAYSWDWFTWVIGALFLASLAANLSSPILTGSISWVPSNRLVYGLPIRPVRFSEILDGGLTRLPRPYYDKYNVREAYVMSSVGDVSIGWGRDVDKGELKRVSTLAQTLSINSTIENVTLPYFQVHSIRWIENLDEIPGIGNGSTPTQVLHPHFEMTPSSVSGFPIGYAILVPNVTTNWSSDPLQSTIIHDTRLLLLYYAYDDDGPSRVHSLTQNLPSNAYKHYWSTSYYAFAWVTFSAGVGRCKDYNCIVSAPSTIRNTTQVEMEPHTLSFQALSMAPVVGAWLVNQNSSLPYLWNNINDYVEAVLARSYSGAWIELNASFQTSVSVVKYIPSLPSLLAQVDQARLFSWLGIQLLVTLLSILFLIIRFHLSRLPLIGDTTLAAFSLDTTEIPAGDSTTQLGGNGLLRIEPSGSKLKVRLE